jgi:hypothetical protein
VTVVVPVVVVVVVVASVVAVMPVMAAPPAAVMPPVIVVPVVVVVVLRENTDPARQDEHEREERAEFLHLKYSPSKWYRGDVRFCKSWVGPM